MKASTIISILLILFFIIVIASPIVLLKVRYNEAVENCNSNGWDTAGTVGAIMDYNFECFDYDKAKKDAMFKLKDAKGENHDE